MIQIILKFRGFDLGIEVIDISENIYLSKHWPI